MSFFHRDPPRNNDGYHARERFFDKFKRKKFLENQTRDSAAGQQSEVKEAGAVIDKAETFTGHAKQRRFPNIRQGIANYKINREAKHEEQELKAFKKHNDRLEARAKAKTEKEQKIFGHELSASERVSYTDFKNARQAEKEASRARFKKNLSTIGSSLGNVQKNAKKAPFAGLTGKSILDASVPVRSNAGGDIFSGPSILDANANRIQGKKKNFESNFGRMLGGRPPRKKLGKHPLDVS